jgi:hypothetical protein
VLLGATLATYGLLGATPIATVIEKNTLTALYNIVWEWSHVLGVGMDFQAKEWSFLFRNGLI